MIRDKVLDKEKSQKLTEGKLRRRDFEEES